MLSMSLTLFKGVVGVLWMIQRKKVLEVLRKVDSDVADQDFRRFILTEIDSLRLQVQRESRTVLNSSHSFYKDGLAQLNEVLNKAVIGKKCKTKRPDYVGKATFYTDVDSDPASDDLKTLNRADLEKSAEKALEQAKIAFSDASREATRAFNNANLDVSERVEATYIRIMGKILQNTEDPSSTLPSCRTYLDELHSLPKVTRIFREAVNHKGKKSPFSKEEDIKISVGVCYLHRIIYDHVASLDPENSGPWTWPCIKIEESKKIFPVDPLRDVRVDEALRKLHEEQKDNLINTAVNLSAVSSFGSEDPGKLISPQHVDTNYVGQFVVADDGDRKIKVFHESGATAEFLYHFHPIPRRLADEDVLSVTTDCRNNLFILIRADKYHHKIYVFSNGIHKLSSELFLSEQFVHCSLIVNESSEIFVLIEEKESKCSAVEVYKADGTFVDSFGQGVLKEPKDMTFDNEQHRLMVLDRVDDGDDRILVFTEQRRHLEEESFRVVASEPIAFHSVSKHVAVSSANTSEPGRLVKISIYDENHKCVSCIHQGEERNEKEERKLVPPKIAVTKDGRIAILAGFVSDCKVIVV